MPTTELYDVAFEGLVKELSSSTGVPHQDVSTILKRLSFPQTLDDYTRMGAADARELDVNNLRVAVKVGRLLVAA